MQSLGQTFEAGVISTVMRMEKVRAVSTPAQAKHCTIWAQQFKIHLKQQQQQLQTLTYTNSEPAPILSTSIY